MSKPSTDFSTDYGTVQNVHIETFMTQDRGRLVYLTDEQDKGTVQFTVTYLEAIIAKLQHIQDQYHLGERTVDAVDHPSHYTDGGPVYEHFRVALAWGLHENAFLYNATKYLCRLGKKDPTKVLEDLRKAEWYLKKAIELEEDDNDPGGLIHERS